MAFLSALITAFLISSASAFTAPVSPRLSRSSVAISRSSPTARNLKSIYEQPEVEEIAHSADDLASMAKICNEEGCSVEAVAKLLKELKAKKTELQYQLTTVSDLIELMAQPDAEPSEWEKWTEAIFRVFDMGGKAIGDMDPIEYPKTLEALQKDDSIRFPRGYSGFVDKSKKRTAWDYYVNTPRKTKKPLDSE